MEVMDGTDRARKTGGIGPIAQVGVALAALIAVYLLMNLSTAKIGFVDAWIAQPILWMAVALLVLLLSRFGAHRLSFSKAMLPLALLAGFFHLAILLLGGLLAGFGHSLHSYAPLVLLGNLGWVSSRLLALELTRGYVVRALQRWPTVAVVVTAVLFTLVMITLSKVSTLDSSGAIVQFLGSRGLPLLSENLLASYLALLGGPLAAIAYRGVLEAFQWFSPILPNLPWVLQAFLGMAAPALAFVAVQSVHSQQSAEAEIQVQPQQGQSGALGWVISGIIVVSVIWFSLGLFPVYPAVAVGNSMAPTILQGDLAVIQKTPSPDTIEVGDIVRYRRNDQTFSVIHRVMEIHNKGGSNEFIVKGDGNNVEDADPLPARRVEGKVLFTIPKLGWIKLGAGELIHRIQGLGRL